VQVTVIGKIVSVRDANMTLTLTITDGTGTVDVDHFLNDSDGGQVVCGGAYCCTGFVAVSLQIV
jgi:hypothetical protein